VTKDMRSSASRIALSVAEGAEDPTALERAVQSVQSSFDKFCLSAGIEALQALLEDEASALCGERYQRHEDRHGRRWGRVRSQVASHGGRVGVDRPRVRSREGKQELGLPSWAAALGEDWLGPWAMNQMLINVSTRKFRRSVRLPGGDVGSLKGDGTSKSAVSRKFVALSGAKLKEGRASDLSQLDLLAI
jgi:putative transposase